MRQVGTDTQVETSLSWEEVGIDERSTDEHEIAKARRPGRWGRFQPPSRVQFVNWLPFWGIVLLGAVLRFWGLGDKPLHHDESLHAYYALQLLQHTIGDWAGCLAGTDPLCYAYNPWLHGPFQFHAIALVYQLSRWLGVADNGVNTTTVRIAAATLGTVIVGLPYFLRDYLGKPGAWLACLLLAVSPSMVYFSRFAREDIYMACFTLLLVVAALRYIRDHQLRWLLLAAVGLSLAYATKESTFLVVGLFGSFVLAVVAWECGVRFQLRARFSQRWRRLPRTFAPVNLALYLLVGGIFAKFFFGWLKSLSIFITTPAHMAASDLFVTNLKDITVSVLPWLGVGLGLFVFTVLVREMAGGRSLTGQGRLADRFDPHSQRLLYTLSSIPWMDGFLALVIACAIFLVLFSALFTNLRNGIGDGIWQGLYYWLSQQEVARGGQPWYYYLLLIPLYEQIGVVFGLVGVGRCVWRPTRFRLFLVTWFVGSLVLYSWASEKMPWLMIHIVIPMLLLAALGLEPCLLLAWRFIKRVWVQTKPEVSEASSRIRGGAPATRRVKAWSGGLACCVGVLAALLLLVPTLQNMYEVSYKDAADSQLEMMVYVQTTVYVNTVMAKIDAVDRKVDNGQHQLHIGVMSGADWPFFWYLRDYPNACFDYPEACPTRVGQTPVILAADDDQLSLVEQRLGLAYQSHVYLMRGQFDQGYMPPQCVPKPQEPCAPQPYVGYGPGLWLSYGDNPPPGASFNPVLAAQHIWNWWWQRVPFGEGDGGDGGYNMELFIQNGIGVQP